MPSTAALNAAHHLAELPGSMDVSGQTLTAVCGAFDIPVGTFNHLRVTPDRVDPQVRSPATIADDLIPRMVPGIRDHPLFALLPSCRDVLRMSDVVPIGSWMRHPLYSEIIAINAAFTFVMLNRDSDFSDNEVRDVTFLQGALIAVRRRDALHALARIPADSPLTAREYEVLVLLDAGLTVSAVARQLVMQPRTAAKHIESIHRKLGTYDRLSTLRRAVQSGWLPKQ